MVEKVPVPEIEKSYNKLSKLAWKHREEAERFHRLCKEVYGFRFDETDRLKDNDRIIDTIDYGIDVLHFSDFDKLMKDAPKAGQ